MIDRPLWPALAALALAFFSAGLPAAEKKAFTAEDLWGVQRVASPAVSPDGTLVVYTITTYDMEENRGNGDLWIVPVAGGRPRRLTSNKASDSSPAWSPDGRRIAFVSKREEDKRAQLYVIAVDGGEPERVTDLPLGISEPKWMPDGKRLVVVSPVVSGSESPAETKKAVEAREKNKVKAHVTENRLYRFWDRWLTDGEFPHLFLINVETRAATDLTPGSRRLFDFQTGAGSFDISPDGSTVVFQANASPEPYATLNADLFSVPTAGGEVRNLTLANAGDDTDPVFSPDGRSIAYGLRVRAGDWPDRIRLAILDLSSGKTRVLTEAWTDSAGAWRFTPDGKRLLLRAEVRARGNLYTVPVAGGTPQLVYRGGTVTAAEPTRDGRAVIASSTVSRPPELAVVGLDGNNIRTLTTTNDARAAGWDLGEVRELTFSGAGGDPVQMFVVYPPRFDATRKYPLVQLIHGGPIGTFGDAFNFRWNAHAFAAPGYIVAMVNFHGSSSFGQPWIESILGAHADKPFTDVMHATDFLIAQGSVDPSRLAAAGGSYGGYLVDWIAGHTDRFSTLVSHAGVYDLLGQSASDDTFGRQHSYGGYPWTNLENVERWSPNRYAANFKTPMLVIHNERDFRVPLTQGLELYGVLTAKGIPARLVSYPDENHWVLKPQNSRHWYSEVLGWLARYLGPDAPKRNPASPRG
ncbi:MAG: S9 family peptidase [Acidobacteriota bacterium]